MGWGAAEEPHVAAEEKTSTNVSYVNGWSIWHLNHSPGDLSTRALYLLLTEGRREWVPGARLITWVGQQENRGVVLGEDFRKEARKADISVDLFPANSMSKMTQK